MVTKEGKSLHVPQERYNRYFDRSVKFVPSPKPSEELVVDKPPRTEKLQAENLAKTTKSEQFPKTTVPYKVLYLTYGTATID